jgi:tetratricopeptide (TPR) repeat protein
MFWSPECDSEIYLPGDSTHSPSILMKARRIKAPQFVDRTASSTIQVHYRPRNFTIIANYVKFSSFRSTIHHITDAAHEAYTLYRKSDHPNHLHNAIKKFEAVLDQCPDDHSHHAAAISNLAHAILCGFTKGVRTDIDHAISLFRSALTHRPKEHPDHPLSILDLCKALHKRHSHRQDRADLEEVAKLYRSLLSMCVEDSHLHFHTIEQCNALPRDSSDEIITLRRDVLQYCPPRHPHRARSLDRLAGDLHARFKESSDIDHINEAVKLSREALDVCPANERSSFLSVLSYYTLERFHHSGDSHDIDECISLTREELSLGPLGEPDRQASLNQLASALEAWHTRYLEITDLEKAKQLRQEASDLFSEYSRIPLPPNQHSEEHLVLGQGQLTRTPEPEEVQQQPIFKSPSSDDQVRGQLPEQQW